MCSYVLKQQLVSPKQQIFWFLYYDACSSSFEHTSKARGDSAFYGSEIKRIWFCAKPYVICVVYWLTAGSAKCYKELITGCLEIMRHFK
jgi:hypothetical protein